MINGRLETLDNMAHGLAMEQSLNVTDWLENLAFVAHSSASVSDFVPVQWDLHLVSRTSYD